MGRKDIDKEQLRREAESIGSDPAERAEARAIARLFDTLHRDLTPSPGVKISEDNTTLTYEGPIDIAPGGRGITLARYGETGPPIADQLDEAIGKLYEQLAGREPNHDDVRAQITVTLLPNADSPVAESRQQPDDQSASGS
jgi:hypothetical protein